MDYSIFSVFVSDLDGVLLCHDCSISDCEKAIQAYIDSNDEASYDDLFVTCTSRQPIYFGVISGFVGFESDFIYIDEDKRERNPIAEGCPDIYQVEPYVDDFGNIEFKPVD